MFRSLPINQVTLNDALFSNRKALVRDYIRRFDLDRLLHTFRKNAGLPSSAEPLGGWEREDCGLRGHFVGHFLSACAKLAFADEDSELAQRAHEIVTVLASCARSDGYVSAFEEEVLDRLEREENRDVWAPYYTLHKILQGLVDCHTLLNDMTALTLAVNLAHYIDRRFQSLSYWKIDGMLRCTKVNPVNEFGGIGDALYSLYELTNDPGILNLAKIFDRDYFIQPLVSGKDILTDLHANTHLPMVLSALHRYRITGEAAYKEAAVRFYEYVKGRTFANGTSSSKAAHFIPEQVSERSEHWGMYGVLGDALTGGESESCCAHNTEKILEELLAITTDIALAEHLECLKYNSILNCASAETGLSQYHQPMGHRVKKQFSTPYDSFWCCTASGIEAMSELEKNIWFTNGNSLLLNAFIASTALWTELGAEIRLETAYPDDSVANLRFTLKEPRIIRLLLKEKSVAAVRVNNAPVSMRTENGFVILERVFSDKDHVSITIQSAPRLIPLQGDAKKAALAYGPILMARLGKQTSFNQRDAGPNSFACLGEASRIVKHARSFGVAPSHQIRILSHNPLTLAMADDLTGEAPFIPLYEVENEEYSVYLTMAEQAEPETVFSFAKDGSEAYYSDSKQ